MYVYFISLYIIAIDKIVLWGVGKISFCNRLWRIITKVQYTLCVYYFTNILTIDSYSKDCDQHDAHTNNEEQTTQNRKSLNIDLVKIHVSGDIASISGIMWVKCVHIVRPQLTAHWPSMTSQPLLELVSSHRRPPGLLSVSCHHYEPASLLWEVS